MTENFHNMRVSLMFIFQLYQSMVWRNIRARFTQPRRGGWGWGRMKFNNPALKFRPQHQAWGLVEGYLHHKHTSRIGLRVTIRITICAVTWQDSVIPQPCKRSNSCPWTLSIPPVSLTNNLLEYVDNSFVCLGYLLLDEYSVVELWSFIPHYR